MSVEIVRHIVDPQRGMEIMDVKDSHGREAQFQCGILPGNPDPSMFFQKCIDEFVEQENLLKEHIKKFVPKVLVALLLLFLAPLAYAAPGITVSASAVTILGTSQTISITVQLIDPLNTGMLKVSGTGIIPIMRASTVTPGSTATVGPIYGNDVILNGLGNANTTYYQVQVFTVTGGIISSTPALQNFYAFTGSGTIDLSTATPLVPNFMNSTAGVSIPGNLSVGGTTTLSAFQTLTSASANPAQTGAIRLANADPISWRNAANSADLQFAPNSLGELFFGAFNSNYFRSSAGFPAQSGAFRLASSDVIAWRNNANNADITLAKNSSDQLTFNGIWMVDVSSTQTISGKTFSTAPIAGGTAAGLTGTGACATITTQSGGSWAGTAKCTGTTGASTLTITPGLTAPNGWVCDVQDETTRGNLFQQTAHTTTTCVLTVTSVTQNDVFVFTATPF